MVKYETLFIIKPDQSPEEIQQVIDRLVSRIDRAGGKAAVVDHWGTRDLAYEVRYRGERLKRGYYVLLTYVGDGTAVEEVERNIKILDPTFRYVSVKLGDGVDPATIGEIEVIRREQRRSRHEGPRPAPDGEELAPEGQSEPAPEGEGAEGAEGAPEDPAAEDQTAEDQTAEEPAPDDAAAAAADDAAVDDVEASDDASDPEEEE